MLEQDAYAYKFINHTNKHVFLTGKAGTGKTTLLHKIVKNTYKKCLVVAPTGIAAINAGGATIHSLFQLPFGTFIPDRASTLNFDANTKLNNPTSILKNLQMFATKRKLLRELELLIIDEVSMLRADLLDAIDVVLKHVKRRNDLPFGGVQLLFIGDLLQLPPVVKQEEWEYLRSYYNSAYFFDAVALQNNKPVYIELNKIYRQTDNRFVEILNNLRNNCITKEDTDVLNTYYKPEYQSKTIDNYITLTTHNNKAQQINRDLLLDLTTKAYYFDAEISGDFNENSYPLDKTLELKLGAQVMFVKNDTSGEQRFFNGKIGIVSDIGKSAISVTFKEDKSTIKVEPYEWQNIKYTINKTSNEIEETIAGRFKQYPIKLAWAITVHKSQGLTFDKAVIDVGSAFASGQVYVALSRLRSLDGLILTSPINFNNISSDHKVNSYSQTETAEQDLPTLLNSETSEFLKTYSIKCFQFLPLLTILRDHTTAYKSGKKMAKQRYYFWAQELEDEMTKIMPFAEKFKRQIAQIVEAKEEGYLQFLLKRVSAARDYFSPIFKDLSSKIFRQIELVKGEKQMKSYVAELLELELQVNEQHKLVNKATLLIKSHIDKIDITSKDVRKSCLDLSRNEQLNKLYSTSTNLPKLKKSNEPKKPKIDTKEVSFKLYKAGHGIEEIAQLRKMVPSTIEGHMTYYIAKGEAKASDFMPDDKLKTIVEASKKLDTLHSASIKAALSDDYSYGEIKMALAAHLSE